MNTLCVMCIIVYLTAEALYGKMRMTEGIWMRKRMARRKLAKLNQEETLEEPITAVRLIIYVFPTFCDVIHYLEGAF